MQTRERHIYGNDGSMDRDGKTKHKELVEGLPTLPDHTGQRKGGHQGYKEGNDDRGSGDDGAVQKVSSHIAGIQGVFVVGPQPILRKAHDIVPKDLGVALQGEGEHPVYGEEVDDQPHDKSDVDDDSHGFAVVFHGLIPPSL